MQRLPCPDISIGCYASENTSRTQASGPRRDGAVEDPPLSPSDTTPTATPQRPRKQTRRRSVELVPRLAEQGYSAELVEQRRRWVEEKTGAHLEQVGHSRLDTEMLRGNIENPIGAAQVPLGVAGPLEVRGEHARGTFYVPLATTEGALVRSYERGMVALTRAGGAEVRIHLDVNRVCPIFHLPSVGAAHDFAQALGAHLDSLRRAAEATTRHGKLLAVEPLPSGRRVIVEFLWETADAQGMNMIVKGTDAACRWLVKNLAPSHGCGHYLIFSGHSAEKRPAGSLLRGGKGKKVVAGARLPRRLVRAMLRTTPEEMVALWHDTVLGHLHSGSLGYNGHYANGLTALFIACGQDVANVVNSSHGVTHFETLPAESDGEPDHPTRDPGPDLWASVTLASLSVATVGGGTALGTARECLAMLGCGEDGGDGSARKLAEITAATLLAGELSMAAAIAGGKFVAAHETYGRNRPAENTDGGPP